MKKFTSRFTFADVKKLLPILQWLPKYNLRKLRCDVTAGIPISLLGISHSLAHAAIAGLPPQYGLYSSFPAMFLYVFFGTSKDLNIGTTMITALLTDQYSLTDQTIPSIASAFAFLVGIGTIIIGIFKLSFIIRFLSFPVISAFVSASAVIIIVIQTIFLLGLSKPPAPFYLKVYHLFKNIEHTRPADAIFGILCIALLVVLQQGSTIKLQTRADTPKWKIIFVKLARVFGIGQSVIVLFLGILVPYLFHVTDVGDIFITIGDIPAGLPEFKVINVV